MIDTVDVLIVGAGPAGCALAYLLADRGIEAVALDRAHFPRVKPCGDTLNPGVVRLLDELGLLSSVSGKQPAHIAGWKVVSGTEPGAVGMYAEGQYGFGMPRRDFDAVLLAAAQRRGANVLEGTRVVGVTRRRHGGFDIDCRRDGVRCGTIRARVLVGADGLRSVVSRRLGMVGRSTTRRKFSISCRLGGVMPRNVGVLHIADRYTVGLAPVHESEPLWNGTVVLPSSAWRNVNGNVMHAYRSCLARTFGNSVDMPEILEGPWTSGPFDRPVQSVAARDVLLIGDAAGYFDPLTGQGVFQALRTAQFAADAIERTCAYRDTQAVAWAKYARQVRGHQMLTRAFQRGVDGILSHAKPRRLALRQLAKRARYMDRIVQFAGDALSIRGLARLDLLARAQGLG